MISLILLYIFVIVSAFIEIARDRQIATMADADGVRTDLENSIIHRGKLPSRAFNLSLIQFLVGMIHYLEIGAIPIYVVLLYPVLGVFISWASINIIAATWWLRQDWRYVGNTAELDKKFVYPHHLYVPFILGITGFLIYANLK